MATQTVVWTALPNGVRNGRLQLSVLVQPRLSGATTLGAFQEWLDWPKRPVTFAVQIGAGAAIPAKVESTGLRPDLWADLFGQATPVSAPDAERRAAEPVQVRSAPITRLRDFAKDQYPRTAALFPTEPPTLFDYRSGPVGIAGGGGDPAPIDLGKVALLDADKTRVRDAIRTGLNTRGYVDEDQDRPAFATEEQFRFLLLEQFHRRRFDDNNPAGARRRQLAEDDLDFHTVIGQLAEYPALMRMLGLVRDLSVPLPSPLPSGPVGIRVLADWTPVTGPAEPDVFLTTTATITATTFEPVAGADAAIAGGLLRLDSDAFDLTEIDTDAMASKLLPLSETVARADGLNSLPAAPPSLDARGLGLSRTDRAQVLAGALKRRTEVDVKLRRRAIGDVALQTEDLTRGFRLDIWDDVTNKWHSLCLRKGSYKFPHFTVTADDEGTVTSVHTEQADDPTMYLHESVARWVGWSLVAPRPGRGTAGDDDQTFVEGDSDADENFPLKASFRATPGTLPKLRYGRTYRMRARAVDLAGNSLPPATNGGFTGASRPVTHRRFDPVTAPNLLLRKPRTEGESPEVMVIRSNFDKPITGPNERHVVPEKTAEHTAEQHGLFDVAATILNPGGMNRGAYPQIAQRDSGTLGAVGTADPGGGDVRFYDTDQLNVPYFPDVLARGAAFTGLPGLPADAVKTQDYAKGLLGWPDIKPFRIRLIEGEGAPTFAGNVLTVRMPKGRVAQVRYSSRIDAAGRDLLGGWAWLLEYLADPANPRAEGVTVASLAAQAVQGRLWQLTPFRTLTLVHAVRQPLAAPQLTKPVAVRKRGETAAKILDKFTFDRLSTSTLDLLASWKEPVDLLAEPGPRVLDGSALAFGLDADEFDTDEISVSKSQQFHDTKFRRVSYELVASSRFAEYFTERRTVTLPANGDAVQLAATGIAPGTDVVRTGAQGRVRDTDYTMNFGTGEIAAKEPLHGATVEVAFVAAPITRSSTEVKPAAVVDVPSSARPVAPDVAYVVPSFGRETTATSSRRLGNGLRVYLNRPWYSSGDGEQLGVIAPTGAPSAALERFLTVGGVDPAFAASSPGGKVFPLVEHYPLAVKPRKNLVLAESARDTTLTGKVAVAPHDVHYDAERKLWYSDITLAAPALAGVYQPFVRLALARYQPVSIGGVELSSVVLAQFAQLSPDRLLTAVFDAADATKVRLTIAGTTYRAGSGAAGPARMTVLVQTADPALTGDVAWSTVSTTTLESGTDSWSGVVTLPEPRGSRPFRLVVEETEQPGLGGNRLVYADAIQI